MAHAVFGVETNVQDVLQSRCTQTSPRSTFEHELRLSMLCSRESLNCPGIPGGGLDVSKLSRIRSGILEKMWIVVWKLWKEFEKSICLCRSPRPVFLSALGLQEVELADSKAVDHVDIDDSSESGSATCAPFPCSHSSCNEFHENMHGFCNKHRLRRHSWKLASCCQTAPWP